MQITPEQKQILDRHYHLWQVYESARYIPNGAHQALGELDNLAQSMGHPPARLHCAACIEELLKDLYRDYNKPE